MIQTGNLQIDALIKDLEAHCLGLLEMSAQRAAEIAVLQEENKTLQAELAALKKPKPDPGDSHDSS